MSKAEEKAKELYPPQQEWDYRDMSFDPNEDKRYAYKRGYEQAMKDFQEKIINNMQDIPMEIQKVINEKFWEML